MPVRTYPNQKPLITGNIRTELKARVDTFKERDINPDTYKKSRYDYEVVRVGNNTSATLTLNTEALQVCVLSPLLHSLLTHD